MEPAVDLNLLWTLKVLLEERNVTRAAERLSLTQSALSHRLRKLRDLFDDPLLVSTGHGLMPTSRAEAIAEPLSDGMQRLQLALQAVDRFDPATSSRPLKIASVDMAEVAYLAPVVTTLQAVAPGVDVVLTAPGPDIYDRLERGDVDVLISPMVPDRAGMRQRFVIEDQPVVVVRRGHPAVNEALTLDRYLELAHILVSPDGTRTSLVDRALADLGRARRIALQVPRFGGAAFVVAQTDMVLTAPARFAAAVSRHLPVTTLVCPLELPGVRIRMAWHERYDRDPGHRWFREFLTEQLAP